MTIEISRSPQKYWAIFKTQLLNSLAYPGDLFSRSLTIVLFLWVFAQLWRVTYRSVGQPAIAGLTFSLYPITLFEGSAKFILFTILPAAFIGAVPVEFVRAFDWATLLQLLAAALVFLSLAVFVFHRGLRRYESGSAIQVQL